MSNQTCLPLRFSEWELLGSPERSRCQKSPRHGAFNGEAGGQGPWLQECGSYHKQSPALSGDWNSLDTNATFPIDSFPLSPYLTGIC